jgi:hypothetical protein
MKFLRQAILILVLSNLWNGVGHVLASEMETVTSPLGVYLEAKDYRVETFPCENLIPLDTSLDEDEETGPTCLIEGNSDVNEESFYLFEKSFQEGQDMLISGQREVLDFFGVDFYEDDIKKGVQIVSDKTSVIFVDDSVGKKEFSQCISQELIYTNEEVGPMAAQWLCLQGESDNLQKITFMSPDVMLLLDAQRDGIFEEIRRSGGSIEEGEYLAEVSGENNSWGKVITIVGGAICLFWIVFIIQKLIEVKKRKPEVLVKIFSWILLICTLNMVTLYMLGVLPSGAFSIYIVIYILASMALVRGWRMISTGSILGKWLHGSDKEFLLRKWAFRLLSICGVVWLYTFFLWPEQQSIPVMGFLIAVTVLVITEGEIREDNEHYRKFILSAFKWLPVIFIVFAMWNNFNVKNEQTWRAEDVGLKQGVELSNMSEGSLDGRSSNNGIILSEPTLITVKNPSRIIGKSFEHATIYAKVQSNQVLNLIDDNGKAFQEDSVFTIPDQEEYSLIARHKVSGLAFYREKSSPLIKISQEETIQEILDNKFEENNVLSDLSQSAGGSNLKKTFGFIEPEVEPETEDEESIDEPIVTTGSVWDIPLKGGKGYSFFIEAGKDPLSLDLDLTKFESNTIEDEFIEISIFNDKGVNEKFYNIKIDQAQLQEIHIEDLLRPGIYRVQINGISDSPIDDQKYVRTNHRIDRIESNSPILIFHVKDMEMLGAGDITFYDVGDQTVIKKDGTERRNYSKKTLETVSFPEEGGRIHSDSPLLIASSPERWRSPFSVNKIRNIRNTTQYILVKDGALGTITQSEEGLVFEKTFEIPRSFGNLRWKLMIGDGQEGAGFYEIKEIKIKFS